MGQKDLAQNEYFNDKRRFADMCNGVLFQGREMIRESDLAEITEDVVYREGRKRRKIIPDKVRLWNGIQLAILSVENQTKVDYKMIFRMMKEEAVIYERQWNERERKLRLEGKLGKKSKLCWKGKHEKFVPVLPIVIYYGTDKKWDAATNLYDIVQLNKQLEPYITNYRLNLFDYHDYEDFSFFKTENRELFEILSCAKDESAMEELMHKSEDRYNELSYDVARIICDIAGIDIKLIRELKEDGREVACMCKAWDDHKELGRREGIREGIREERILSIKNLCTSLKMSAAQAMDALMIPINEREQLAGRLPQ